MPIIRTNDHVRTVPCSILPASHALVFLALHVANGLAVPVLSLMLIARGASAETLPLSVGITLAVTCAFEVPSGIVSDALGRRAVFVCAMALHAGAYVALLMGMGLAGVLASSVLRGFALAARTGSLEAIEIDRVMDTSPEGHARLAALDALNGRFALLETAGTAAGGLFGGMFAALDGSYTMLIVAVILLSSVSMVGALATFPRDARRSNAGARASLRDELEAIVAMVRRSDNVRLVLACSISAGIAMVALETYWQLDLLALLGGSCEWMLGIVSCLGMAAASAGSAFAMRGGFAARAFGGNGRRVFYILLQGAMVVVLAVLSLAATSGSFIVFYALMYFVLGARSVIEQTLLHNAVPSSERSGMASVQSVAIRGGGVFSSAAGSALVPVIGLNGVWIALAAIAVAPAAPAILRIRTAVRR